MPAKTVKRQLGPELSAPPCMLGYSYPEICSLVVASHDLYRTQVLLGPLTASQRMSFRLDHPFKEDTTDHTLRLRDDILLSIFSYLSRPTLGKVMRVCTRWNRVGHNNLLWRRVDMSERQVGLHSVLRLCDRGTTHMRMAETVVQRNEAEQRGLNDSVSEVPSSNRLQYLDLSRAVIGEDSLAEMLSFCRQLKKVSLENGVVDDSVLHQLAKNPELDTLNLTVCRGVTVNGLTPLFTRCSQLTQLNLAWTGLDRRCVSYVCQAVPVSIQQLNMSGAKYDIEDEDVKRLCRRCASLTDLDLSDSELLTTESTIAAVMTLPNLTTLSLSRCYGVDFSSFPEGDELPNLRVLNVFGNLDEDSPQLNSTFILKSLEEKLPHVRINEDALSTIARPTVGQHWTSIWGERVRT